MMWCSRLRELGKASEFVAINTLLRCTPNVFYLQLEDPGKLVQVGYSAGSRSSPKFDWVKNLLSKRHSAEAIEDMNIKTSSACAFMWNLVRSRLPAEVVDDFANFITDAELVRMDANSVMMEADGKGVYTVNIGEDQFDFHKAELAPLTAVFAENYSRCTE
jgi:hypothetical protein